MMYFCSRHKAFISPTWQGFNAKRPLWIVQLLKYCIKTLEIVWKLLHDIYLENYPSVSVLKSWKIALITKMSYTNLYNKFWKQEKTTTLDQRLSANSKKHLCSILLQICYFFAFFAFFQLFSTKKRWKCLDQRLGCAAPKCLSKYTTNPCGESCGVLNLIWINGACLRGGKHKLTVTKPGPLWNHL